MRALGGMMFLLSLGCAQSPSRVPAVPDRLPVVESFVMTADSVRIYYRMLGSGAETVIVPNAQYHGQQLDSLASANRRLVLYDQRGRGRSDSVPAAKTTLDGNFADIEALRQALGADSIALIGWSGTGMELFAYALRYPHRVTRLVQLAPVAPRWIPYTDSLMSSRSARTDSAARARLRTRIAAGEFANREAELCRAQARLTTPATFGDTGLAHLAPDACEWPNEWVGPIGRHFDALLGSMGSFDWRPDLGRVTAPRLVIHGELDNTPLAGNCEWAEGQPTARLLVVRGAGHWPQYERPALTIHAIGEFLDGKWPDESRAVSPNGCRGLAKPLR